MKRSISLFAIAAMIFSQGSYAMQWRCWGNDSTTYLDGRVSSEKVQEPPTILQFDGKSKMRVVQGGDPTGNKIIEQMTWSGWENFLIGQGFVELPVKNFTAGFTAVGHLTDYSGLFTATSNDPRLGKPLVTIERNTCQRLR